MIYSQDSIGGVLPPLFTFEGALPPPYLTFGGAGSTPLAPPGSVASGCGQIQKFCFGFGLVLSYVTTALQDKQYCYMWPRIDKIIYKFLFRFWKHFFVEKCNVLVTNYKFVH